MPIAKKKEIHEHIKEFIIDTKEIIESSNIYNPQGFNFWSFKKLIFLRHYIRPFIDISKANGCEPIYIDMFSGCGANKINKEKCIGSPIVSIMYGIKFNNKRNELNRFSKWFFIDNEKDLCDALEKRVEKSFEKVNEKYKINIDIKKDVKIFHGDCNDKIDDIIKTIKDEYRGKKISVLIFVDPYNFNDAKWSTIEKIYRELIYVDLIYCFFSGEIKRALHKCRKENLDKVLSPSLRNKDKIEIDSLSEEKCEEAFAKDIKSIAGRSISYLAKGISAKTSKSTELYRIMLFTHLNVKAVENIIKNIYKELNSIDVNDIKNIIDCVTGKTKRIKDFL